jgi:hypothetical protein
MEVVTEIKNNESPERYNKIIKEYQRKLSALGKRETEPLIGGLPCLIRDNSGNFSDTLEVISGDLPDKERYARNARNMLRYILRGSPVCPTKGDPLSESPLYQPEIKATLLEKRDPQLLKAARDELQGLLQEAFRLFTTSPKDLNESDQIRAEKLNKNKCIYMLFQSTLLSILPFFDPDEKEGLSIPQITGSQWQLVNYHFEKLDISPQEGPLSAVMQEGDRVYAYGLVPDEPGFPSHLLFIGTTYPGGQGYDINNLYNVHPLGSIGAHDMTQVDVWIIEQNDGVIVSGHSKGAVNAMETAIKYPNFIKEANCLNPTAFSGSTLAQLGPHWNMTSPEKRPTINIYAQEGDPIFTLEKGFLPGMKIYRVVPNTPEPAMNAKFVPNFLAGAYERHISHFMGRDQVLIYQDTKRTENVSRRRELFNDIKYVTTILLFPITYISTYVGIATRRIEQSNNAFLSPIKPMVKNANIAIQALAGFGKGVTFFIVGGITAILSGIKIAAKSLFIPDAYQPKKSYKKLKTTIMTDLASAPPHLRTPHTGMRKLFTIANSHDDKLARWNKIKQEANKRTSFFYRIIRHRPRSLSPKERADKRQADMRYRAIAKFSKNVALYPSIRNLEELVTAQYKREVINMFHDEIYRLKNERKESFGPVWGEFSDHKIAAYQKLITALRKSNIKQSASEVMDKMKDEKLPGDPHTIKEVLEYNRKLNLLPVTSAKVLEKALEDNPGKVTPSY